VTQLLKNRWRTGMASIAAVIAMSTGFVALGTGSAYATTDATSPAEGSYVVTYAWNASGDSGTFTLILGAKNDFTTNIADQSGKWHSHGDHLAFRFRVPHCGAVYTGTGSPSAGFSGTSEIKKSHKGCIAKGTTGTWSTGPVSAVAPSSPSSGASAGGLAG
jgi:hypothetical protein